VLLYYGKAHQAHLGTAVPYGQARYQQLARLERLTDVAEQRARGRPSSAHPVRVSGLPQQCVAVAVPILWGGYLAVHPRPRTAGFAGHAEVVQFLDANNSRLVCDDRYTMAMMPEPGFDVSLPAAALGGGWDCTGRRLSSAQNVEHDHLPPRLEP